LENHQNNHWSQRNYQIHDKPARKARQRDFSVLSGTFGRGSLVGNRGFRQGIENREHGVEDKDRD
jgi:hypothetical protein